MGLGKEWVAECDSAGCYASLVIPVDKSTPLMRDAVAEYRANGWQMVAGPNGYAVCPQCEEKRRARLVEVGREIVRDWSLKFQEI